MTSTNRGASAVCRAALAHKGISDDDLLAGYQGDPASKSKLRILCRPGLLYRLTRNLGKRRRFVNGSLAVCVESLKGCEVFIDRLVSSGNLVLVHPVEEKGQRFLSLTYGYATTVRRAQGASLDWAAFISTRGSAQQVVAMATWLYPVQVERRMFLVWQAATE